MATNKANLQVILSVILLAATSVFSAIDAQVKDNGLKPQWMHRLPVPTNGTYHFRAFRIDGNNASAAIKSLPEVASLYMERQFSISGATVETFEMQDRYMDGKRQSLQLHSIRDTVFTKTGNVKVRIAVVDEYVARDGIWFLCTLPDPAARTAIYDDLEITTRYGGHGLWRSAIVPGWGQMYKGSYVKGGLVLGGCVALAGGIIFSESQRQAYISNISKTHDAAAKQIYANRANNFGIARNVCIGALAALYIYNIIDAIAAPGGKRIIVTPAASADGSVGISGFVNF